MTDSASPAIQRLEDIFKDLVWKAVVEAALKQLYIAVPWLSWGPVGAVVGYLGNMIADKIFAQLQLAFDLQAIKFINESHKKEFDKASVALLVIGTEKGFDSQEFKQANENAKAALAKFVSSTGN